MLAKAVKERWILMLVLAAFVIAKIPVLHYPFFWDESWSYAPGVKLMYQHGPSLMPNAIDIFYSRGHPLFFYASAATWMHIFGPSHISQHSFALLVSVLLLVSVYEICLKLFNQRVALLALLLVGGQVMFFVQSTMVLPEVMVTLFSLLALYFYTSRKYWQTFLSLSVLLLTKESGATLGLILGAHAFITLLKKEENTKHKVLNFAAILGAGAIIGGFYLLQRKLNGWFLFPDHTGLLDLSWSMVSGKMRFCAEIIFTDQLRGWLFALLVMAGVAAAIRTREFRLALPLITGLLLYILIGSYFGYITRRLYIPLVFGSLLHSFYVSSKLDDRVTSKARQFIVLSLLFWGVYLSFTSINFLSARYLLCPITISVVLAAWYFEFAAHKIGRVFIYLVGDCILILFFSFKFNTKMGDIDLGMYAAMEVQQDAVRYLELHSCYDKEIVSNSYLHQVHLTNPMTGFRQTPIKFSKVSNSITPTTELVIRDNIEIDSTSPGNTPPEGFQQVFYSSRGESWVAVYGRK